MKLHSFSLLILFITSWTFGQDLGSVHLRYRPAQDEPLVSDKYIEDVTRQGATLENIDKRVTEINDDVKDIKNKLDDQVMPTIHVMEFFKWLFGALIVAIITVAVNNNWHHRHRAGA